MDINQLRNPKNIERLAQQIGAANIGHELVLSDNLSADFIGCEEFNPFESHPLKVVGATLLVCIRGTTTYRINLSDYSMKAGQIMVILPGSIIQVITATDDLLFASVSFACDYYDAIVDIGPEMRNNPVIDMSESDFDEIMSIYTQLKNRLSRMSGDSAKSIAKGYIRVICSILLDNWQKCDAVTHNSGTRPNELYNRFLMKVQEGYREQRSVKYYADRLCVSPKYLSSIVKKECGRNASEFIDELTMMEAKALLAVGTYSVQQVADLLNFPNPSYFSRFFKKHSGISPSDYIRTNFKNT